MLRLMAQACVLSRRANLAVGSNPLVSGVVKWPWACFLFLCNAETQGGGIYGKYCDEWILDNDFLSR